jgi:WD40 repeat protein
MEKICICDLNTCKMYLDNPVILPCGKTICQNHLQSIKKKFKCDACTDSQPHLIPKSGFPKNEAIQRVINLNYHLDGLHREAKLKLNEFESKISNYEKTKNIDSDEYISSYFQNLEEKITTHRNEFINEINKKANDLLIQLSNYKSECEKGHKAKIILENNDYLNINNLKHLLRCPNIEEQTLRALIETLNNSLNEIESKIDKYKNDLISYKFISFKQSDDKSFGRLAIEYLHSNTEDSKSCYKTLVGHKRAVKCILINETLNILISGSIDNIIRIFSLETCKLLKEFDQHELAVTSLLQIKDYMLISGSWDKTIKFWNIEKGYCETTLNEESPIYSMCLIPYLNQFVCGRADGIISIFDLNECDKIFTFKAHDELVSILKLLNQFYLLSSSDDKTIKLWNLNNNQCLKIFIGHTDFIYTIDVTFNGLLISGGRDNLVKIWNLETGDCTKTINMNVSVHGVKLLNQNILAIGTGNFQDNLKLFDLNSNIVISTLNGHDSSIFGLDVLSNGNLVSYSYDKTIKIWNTRYLAINN